jgi:hypothetical protein
MTVEGFLVGIAMSALAAAQEYRPSATALSARAEEAARDVRSMRAPLDARRSAAFEASSAIA